MMNVKCGQVGRPFLKVNAPEAIFSIQLTEACGTVKSMRNLLEGRAFVMLLHNGLVHGLGVETDTKGTIRLLGISEGRYPLSRLEDRYYHPHSNHVIEGALYLLSVLYGYLPSCMLDWGYVRVGPDGISARHDTNCVK